MRLYLELYENIPEEEKATNIGGFMRFPIATLDDAKLLLNSLSSFYDLSKYSIKIHKCYHDEGKPCILEDYKG